MRSPGQAMHFFRFILPNLRHADPAASGNRPARRQSVQLYKLWIFCETESFLRTKIKSVLYFWLRILLQPVSESRAVTPLILAVRFIFAVFQRYLNIPFSAAGVLFSPPKDIRMHVPAKRASFRDVRASDCMFRQKRHHRQRTTRNEPYRSVSARPPSQETSVPSSTTAVCPFSSVVFVWKCTRPIRVTF